jgi:hypothetical protein
VGAGVAATAHRGCAVAREFTADADLTMTSLGPVVAANGGTIAER